MGFGGFAAVPQVDAGARTVAPVAVLALADVLLRIWRDIRDYAVECQGTPAALAAVGVAGSSGDYSSRDDRAGVQRSRGRVVGSRRRAARMVHAATPRPALGGSASYIDGCRSSPGLAVTNDPFPDGYIRRIPGAGALQLFSCRER